MLMHALLDGEQPGGGAVDGSADRGFASDDSADDYFGRRPSPRSSPNNNRRRHGGPSSPLPPPVPPVVVATAAVTEIPYMPPPPSLANMVIGSVDTLRGSELDLDVPPAWNDKPPLLQSPRGGPETPQLLKGMIRKGVPPALRCAIWLSNIIQAVHPEHDENYWHEYRTLAKVRALDGAYEMLLRQLEGDNGGGNNKQDQEQRQEQQHSGRRIHGEGGDNNDDSVWDNMLASDYGRKDAGVEELPGGLLSQASDKGRLAQKRVLVALEQVLVGVEYAPVVPVLTALMLTAMSESYTFCAVREMAHEAVYYFPATPQEHVAWCRAFADVLRKLHKQTADHLQDLGVLDDDQLMRYLFADFFLDVLPVEHVLRIVDIYTLEGSKVVFRFGIALLVLYKRHSSEQNLSIRTAAEWWHTMRQWTHSPRFSFDVVARKAYGVHGRGMRKQMRFPRRQILHRIIRMEEERYLEEQQEQEQERRERGDRNNGGDDTKAKTVTASRPLGLLRAGRPLEAPPYCHSPAAGGFPIGDDDEKAVPVLACPVQNRLRLAEWLPLTLSYTNMQLLYSTNHHGRSLEMFYNRVRHAKHTILLAEVIPSEAAAAAAAAATTSTSCSTSTAAEGGGESSHNNVIIGMYASQAWRVCSEVYGDGECFLFRLQPNADCWKWKPKPPGGVGLATGGNPLDFLSEDHLSLESAHSSSEGGGKGANNDAAASSPTNSNYSNNNNQTALLEQFMVSTKTFLSMGGNPDGSCGLRFNEDWTKGESSRAVGFDNAPLHGVVSAENDDGRRSEDDDQKPGGGATATATASGSGTSVSSVFDVGLVEVYGLVRQMDGRAV